MWRPSDRCLKVAALASLALMLPILPSSCEYSERRVWIDRSLLTFVADTDYSPYQHPPTRRPVRLWKAAGVSVERVTSWFSPSSWKGPKAPPVPVVQETLVRVSLWPYRALLGVLPAWWLLRRYRAARAAELAFARAVAGQCVACGYDLRASPEACPECGKTPPARPQAAWLVVREAGED